MRLVSTKAYLKMERKKDMGLLDGKMAKDLRDTTIAT